MKRSKINELLREALEFFASHRFVLPPWGYWTPQQWRDHRRDVAGPIAARLGWDVTDFGSGQFPRVGLLLFTLRNSHAGAPRPYCEKIMIVRDGQVTPWHYHQQKMEDIINRGGADLVLQVAATDSNGRKSPENVTVMVDAMPRTLASGQEIVLRPGQSICMERGVSHCFFGRQGTVLVGEVSTVNDDMTDNYFFEPAGRFPKIDEDEPALHPLVCDYEAMAGPA